MTSINDYLPPEILVKIFSHYIETEGPLKFLTNIRQVCKQWRDLSTDSPLWKEISWTSMSRNFERLLRFGEMGLLTSTHTLDLSTTNRFLKEEADSPRMSAEELLQVLGYCQNVRSLDVSHNEITEEVMQTLAVRFPKIEKLAIIWPCEHLSDEDDDGSNCPQVVTLNGLEPILMSFGRSLTYLELGCHLTDEDRLIWKIADFCPVLEELHLHNIFVPIHDRIIQFPIDILQVGCPELRTLIFTGCKMEIFKELKGGFREMKIFHADDCDFKGLDIGDILENSTELEGLKIIGCVNLKFLHIHRIPSNKMKDLCISYFEDDLEPLEKAMKKWRERLENICVIQYYYGDFSNVVRTFLEDNQSPVIESFDLIGRIDVQYLETLVRVGKNLKNLNFLSDESNDHLKIFWNRDEVLRSLL